ncbi:hypothetical protein NE237_009901 [Protea cynaroides]|uniref:BHLH domain-containing protein n=1 Tax=Protea cynaroides TaxID=273540 RepID=A0A9Q0KYQ2_9MAGN|nr:hypothetical protein NE237_009901 [Protea cynaroides]
MGPSTLRQLLRSLCHNSPWKYAVFWKLEHCSGMILTWEDGYCDCSRPGGPAQSLLQSVCLNEMNGNLPFGNETSSDNGTSVVYPIQLAVQNMSCLLYSMGEGVVGKVASTAKYCWVFADTVCAGVNSELIPGYPHEWLVQFAAGIKTILLVPVVPHGVLQLGSLEMVHEDPALVTNIKDMFNTFQYVVPGELHEDLQPIPGSVEEAGFGVLSVGPAELSFPHNHSMTSNHLELRGDVFDLSYLEKGLQASSECNYSDIEIFFQQTDVNFDLIRGFTGRPCGEGIINQMNHGNASGFLGFTVDSELHKELEPSNGGCDRFMCNPTISEEVVCGSLDLICHGDLNVGAELSTRKSIGWCTKGGDAGHLLEAVVANVQGDSDNAASGIPNLVRSPSSSSGQFGASCQTPSQSEGSILVESDPLSLINMTSTNVTFAGKAINKTGVSSFGSMMSTLIDEEQPKKVHAYMQSGVKGAKLSRVSRTKADINQGPRARPRDRQMIQDRVKELRELVPNGAKCSIDALLDQTIKHLMFLRSVTDQAEKLRLCPLQKAGRMNWKSDGVQGHQNGMSWAFEMGSKLGVPPIIVEDLDHPGHLLIEMLCQEHGVFLEIAQIIGHLELTILKGVMETRADEIWAHFIVEASRGFQRMEVFWPLMLLLQRNSKSISSTI